VTVRYRVHNNLGRPVPAHAVMNTALRRGPLYRKQECFGFTNRRAAAGETLECRWSPVNA